jgi:hypothetical protein
MSRKRFIARTQIVTGDAMWEAMAWAERRGLSVVDATEELSR